MIFFLIVFIQISCQFFHVSSHLWNESSTNFTYRALWSCLLFTIWTWISKWQFHLWTKIPKIICSLCRFTVKFCSIKMTAYQFRLYLLLLIMLLDTTWIWSFYSDGKFLTFTVTGRVLSFHHLNADKSCLVQYLNFLNLTILLII